MEYVTLGKTGLRVSRMGLGGIPIQRVDAAGAAALLEAVEAAGINYIDTARGYTSTSIRSTTPTSSSWSRSAPPAVQWRPSRRPRRRGRSPIWA